MTSILLGLDLIRLTSGLADASGIECPGCDDLLVIHQPDEQSPDHLLGTCRECGAWFLIDEAGELMLRLPAVGALRDAQSASRGAVA
jgi:hypothetical protein